MSSQKKARLLISEYERALGKIRSDKAILEFKRELFKKHLWYLSFYVLERVHKRRVNLMDDYVVDYCNEIQLHIDKSLFLVTRGHYKSTLGTVNDSIRSYLNNPSITIGIFSDTYKRAKGWHNEIRQKLQYEELIALYPKLLKYNKNDYDKFTENEIILPGHKMVADQTPTMMPGGLVDGMPTGKHFDLMKIDDIVNKENIGSPEQIMKVRNALGYLKPLGKIDGSSIRQFIGTTYDLNDAYSIMKKDGSYKIFFRPYFELDKDGVLTDIPISIHGSVKEIEDMKKDKLVGTRIVNAQYFLTPNSEEEKKFNKEDINYFSELPKDKTYTIYISVDPAISEKKASCLNAITVIAISNYREFYILEIIEKRTSSSFSPLTVINAMFMLHKKYSELFGRENIRVVVETVAYQKVLIYLLTDKMRNQQYFFKPIEHNPHKDKFLRIGALQPVVENKGMFVKPEHHRLVTYFDEFPYCESLDVLDTISQVNAVCRKPYEEESVKEARLIPKHSVANIVKASKVEDTSWRHKYIGKNNIELVPVGFN